MAAPPCIIFKLSLPCISAVVAVALLTSFLPNLPNWKQNRVSCLFNVFFLCVCERTSFSTRKVSGPRTKFDLTVV